jgi:NADP-dependent 3-hydroxy acid dehydrogenase YdfG
MDFAAKVVVITGASRGLGLELARQFAKEAAHVVLLARQREQLAEVARELESIGARVTVLQCDVTKENGVRAGMASIIRDLGRVDVLINNAGIIQVGPAQHMNNDDFAEAMAIHFWAPLYLMRAVIPEMKRQGHGRIVNIASIGAKIAFLTYCRNSQQVCAAGLSEDCAQSLRKMVSTLQRSSGIDAHRLLYKRPFKGQQRKEFAPSAPPMPGFRPVRPGLAPDIENAATVRAIGSPPGEVVAPAKRRSSHLVAEALPTLRVLPEPAGAEATS